MKVICTKCGHPKDPDDFPWRDKVGGVRKKYCRECQGKYHEKWAAENGVPYRHAWRKENRKLLQAWLRDYKDGKPCHDCGKPYPFYVLDFDHREPGSKRMDVARMTNGSVSLLALQREIVKCDLVCANCHRERTHKQRQKLKGGHLAVAAL